MNGSSPSSFQYEFTPEVKATAKLLGIKNTELEDMVLRSAKITNAQANRRFRNFLFWVEGNKVTRFFSTDAPANERISLKDNEFVVYEECETCEGAGCDLCEGGTQRVVRSTKRTF